jgi:uncharacterized membrane protein
MDKPSDQSIENIIGAMLRIGVVLSSALVLGGGIWYLLRCGAERPEYGTFHGEPAALRSIPGIVRGAVALDPRSWIQLGLLLLIATPVARVVFSIGAFAAQRDRMYVVITLLVAAILFYSLFADDVHRHRNATARAPDAFSPVSGSARSRGPDR